MEVEPGDKIEYYFEMAGVELGPMVGTVQAHYPWEDDVPEGYVKVELEGSSDTSTVDKDKITEVIEHHSERYTSLQ